MIYNSPITFHNDVRADLEEIKVASPDAHAKLLALFRQLKADLRLTEKLLDHGFGDKRSADISVNKWLAEWKTGKNLWRLKSWDMEDLNLKYRVIYLFLPKEARFVVMAVVKRGNFDYDNANHPIRKRIASSIQRSYGLG